MIAFNFVVALYFNKIDILIKVMVHAILAIVKNTHRVFLVRGLSTILSILSFNDLSKVAVSR